MNHPIAFFDSHGSLWVPCDPKSQEAEAFGPTGAARPVRPEPHCETHLAVTAVRALANREGITHWTAAYKLGLLEQAENDYQWDILREAEWSPGDVVRNPLWVGDQKFDALPEGADRESVVVGGFDHGAEVVDARGYGAHYLWRAIHERLAARDLGEARECEAKAAEYAAKADLARALGAAPFGAERRLRAANLAGLEVAGEGRRCGPGIHAGTLSRDLRRLNESCRKEAEDLLARAETLASEAGRRLGRTIAACPEPLRSELAGGLLGNALGPRNPFDPRDGSGGSGSAVYQTAYQGLKETLREV